MPAPSTPTDLREYWNVRYQAEASRYGGTANQFVVEHLSGFAPCRALDAACGQGRNAVWLAEQGHTVIAVDLSDVAVGQAETLARDHGVDIEFIAADLLDWDAESREFDLVVLSYLQLPPEQRKPIHVRLASTLAPGGTLLSISHHADNLEHGVGGPDYPEVLYTEADLVSDFEGLVVDRNESVERTVERAGMSGTAIDLLFMAHRA